MHCLYIVIIEKQWHVLDVTHGKCIHAVCTGLSLERSFVRGELADSFSQPITEQNDPPAPRKLNRGAGSPAEMLLLVHRHPQ